jgi:uncharacterized protein
MYMQTKAIKFAGRQLTGEWHYDDKSHPKKQLIIVCHGYQSSRKDPTIVAVTEGLNKNGHDTCTFNFSANTGGFDVEHQVKDITQVVENFKSYREIILLASSFGALTAAIATKQIPEVKGLITLNGFFGEGKLGQKYRDEYRKFRVAALVAPKYRRIWRYYRQELQPALITVPVLVIHSKVDQYVFIQQSRDFYDKLKAPKHFIELQSANHGVTSTADRKLVISEIDTWLATAEST